MMMLLKANSERRRLIRDGSFADENQESGSRSGKAVPRLYSIHHVIATIARKVR